MYVITHECLDACPKFKSSYHGGHAKVAVAIATVSSNDCVFFIDLFQILKVACCWFATFTYNDSGRTHNVH